MLTLNGQRSIVNFKVGPKEKIPLSTYPLRVCCQEMRPLSWKTAAYGGPPTRFLFDQKRLILTPKGPPGPPKHPKRPPNDVISIQGSCPKHPREFWKFHFAAVGFRHVRPRGAQDWFTTGANPFFGLQIFQIFKTSRVDRYDLAMKKSQWDGGSICSLSRSRGVQRYDLTNGDIDQFWLWHLRGRKCKCQPGQRHSNPEILYG